MLQKTVVVASSLGLHCPRNQKEKKMRVSKAGHSEEVVFAQRCMNLFPASRPTLEISEDAPWWARTTSFQVSTDISVLALFGKSWQPSLTCFLVC